MLDMLLFKECDVYAPEPRGRKDVLVAGGKIAAVADEIPEPKGVEVEVVSAGGLYLIPGLIDAHVHIAGAGGEGGPQTRTPELRLSQLLEAGVTTVVGCLGTDGLTRDVTSVLMKAKALRAEGVSAYMFTGSYQVPTPTITGDVGRDIALIEEVIGVGEIAISDHRSSGPTTDELIKLAGHARVGGMLGGKAGIVNFHMGDAKDPFRPIREIVERSELGFTQFLPTHCNRNEYIFEDAKEYGKEGYVDLTASSWKYFPEYEIKPAKAVVELLKAGVPIEHITMTSDGCGSLPDFDEHGNLTKIETGQPRSILTELKDAVWEEDLPLEKAIRVATANPAGVLNLGRKGRIEVGADADLVFLDKEFRVYHMVANGTLMVRAAEMLAKGTYE
jgi:beta-aspartyl-dipeptidase (metallo-type)